MLLGSVFSLDQLNRAEAKIGEEYAGYVKDQAMAQMMGDVMAVKRLGEVKGGRKVIGRQKIHFRRLEDVGFIWFHVVCCP